MSLRYCKTCDEVKEPDLFEKSNHKPGTYTNRCLACKRRSSAASYKKSTPETRQLRRENYPAKYQKEVTAISGNWELYFARLVGQPKRAPLKVDMLLDLLKRQDGKCAITGVAMTCIREVGKKYWSNASIDRLVHGAPYTLDNIRLVTTRANTMRLTMSDLELVTMCRLVLANEETLLGKARVVKHEPEVIECAP